MSKITDRIVNGRELENGVVATDTELALKAPLSSPAFTDTPTAPTPQVDDNSTKLATTEFVVAHAAAETYVPPTSYGLTWQNSSDTYYRTGSTDYTQVQRLMKRCVLNANGTVNYFLDPANSTLQADGVTASDLTGASGNVMVQIPKFYVKYDNTANAKNMSVSLLPETGYTVAKAFVKAGVEVDFRYYRAYEGYNNGGTLISRSGVTPTRSQTIDTFRTYARANGAGWEQTDWNLLFAVQTLLFIEIGTFNSQSVLGNGNDTGADYGMTTGGSNSIGNASSPATNDDTWMSYRGIENLYGDIWEFTDGINISERGVFINDDHTTFASDVFTGDYVSSGVTMPVASGQYISDMNFSVNGFIPTAVTGSSATYITDGLWTNTGSRIMLSSGSAGTGLLDGAACYAATDASSYAGASTGSSISF
jgi:hypothetical protein